MRVSMVVAASENNVIGLDNRLPWHLPDDLRFFKKMTTGKPVIMGRLTWESLGKPLPGRLNIVLSSSLAKMPEGVLLFSDLDSALSYLEQHHAEEACIIGGGKIYHAGLSRTDTVYMTRVHTVLERGTAFFPELLQSAWTLAWEEHHTADERHAFAFTFQKWERGVV